MDDHFLNTPVEAVRYRRLAELKKRFINAEAAMEAGDYGLALVMAGDKEPEIYASALILCGAVDEGLSLLDNLKAGSVHSRWVRAYAAWTKGDIEDSIRHLSTLRGSHREAAALKLIELLRNRPIEIGVFSTIQHPGAEALESDDDFNIRKVRLTPEQVGSTMTELQVDLDKPFDFIFNLDAYGAHLPSDFHDLNAPKIFYALDHDGLISTRHFDLARADTLIVTGSNEHDELERVYSRRVSTLLGYDIYQTAANFEPPDALDSNEIEWDILVTGRPFTPYYIEKAVKMFDLVTLEDPELRIRIFQDFLPWSKYYSALRSCAATIVINRFGSVFTSRGAEALRLGCQVLHFDGEACASLAKFMGGGLHCVEEGDLVGAIRKARNTRKNWAENRSRGSVRRNILDVFPNSPEREIRLIKFGIFENALSSGHSFDSSLPAATWVPVEHQTYSYTDGLTVFTRIATINLKAPDKTAVHLNNAGAALTYAALFHDGTGKFLERALAVYETAVATYPDHLVSHFNRGRISWLAGNRNLAVKELTWVADMAANAAFDPSIETILSHRIHALNEMCPYGHYWRAASEAIAAKDESFEKPRRIIQATACTYLAQDCFEKEDFDGARIQALKATRLFPDHFPALVLLARTDLELGDFYEEGVAAFRRAFSVYPVIINNYLSVGVALEERVSLPERALHLVRQWSLFRLRVRTEEGELWPASGETIETFEGYYENLPSWVRARMTREGEPVQDNETTMSFEQKMEKTRYSIAPYLKEYDGIKLYWQPFVMTQTTPDYRSDVVNTDSFGFRYSRDRNGREVHFDNSRDCKVNLFVGNSTAFGVGVTSDGKTLPSYLAKSTKETWLNLSFRTHTIRQNFITFSSVRDLIGPINKIVLFAGATDLLIYLINSLHPKPWGTFYHYANYFEKFYNVPPGFLSRIENHYRERKSIVDQMRLDLSNWKVMARGLGAQLLFVYQPIAELSSKKQSAEEVALYEAIENSPQNPYSGDLKLSFFKANEWFTTALNESCVRLDIPYLDANTFNSDGAYHGKWLFTDPFHLNDRGSKVIADLITEMILKSQRPEDKK